MHYMDNPLAWDLDEKQSDEVLINAKRKQYEIDQLYYEVFTSKHGKKLLDMLTKNILEASTWSPFSDPQKAIYNGFAREGQNTIIRAFKDGVERIKQAPKLEDYAKL